MSNESVVLLPGHRVGWRVLENGCWEWTAARAPNGYGRVGIKGERRTAQAHRYIYELSRGPVPEGLDLDHLCRNRACVNPDHLEPVTRQVNSWRGAKCKLTMQQVDDIRQEYFAGGVVLRELSAKYGVTHSHLSRLIRRDRGYWSARDAEMSRNVDTDPWPAAR